MASPSSPPTVTRFESSTARDLSVPWPTTTPLASNRPTLRIRLINPNTTVAMTETIGAAARSVAATGTLIEAVTPSMGPASIESHYEEALAVPGLLEQIADGERAGVHGFVVACFGDPGVDAARELATGPVLGIAEAAMRMASMVGRTFGVVTTLGRTVGRATELVHRYGYTHACAAIRACEVPVLALDDPTSDAHRRITAECHQLVGDLGVDAVVLGCAGMAPLCRSLSQEIGVPVIEGVAAATVLIEGMLRLGLRSPGRGEYAAPPDKPITGLLGQFTRPADGGTASATDPQRATR